jgi:hypothetical protein
MIAAFGMCQPAFWRPKMTAEQFSKGLRSLFGEDWRSKAYIAFDCDRSSVNRWAAGMVPVPGPCGKLLEALTELDTRRRRRRYYEINYTRRKRQEAKAAQEANKPPVIEPAPPNDSTCSVRGEDGQWVDL